MNTIKCGKIFCDRFNKENNLSLTPKEIFTTIIMPLCFKTYTRSLISWTNSTFSKFNTSEKNNKTLDENFAEYLTKFCESLETDKYGIMTSQNVYAGMALPTCDKRTTEFCYNTNIYFTIDERYCSFIGSLFTLNCGGFNIVINNEDVIWLLFESMNNYRKELTNNEILVNNQIQTYNTIYFYEKINGNVQEIIEKYGVLNKGRIRLSSEIISFEKILFLLTKFDNIKYIEISNLKNTNTSCGQILLNIPYIKTQYELFRSLYKSVHMDFNSSNYSKLFGRKDIIYKAIMTGRVGVNFFNPLQDADIKTIKKSSNIYQKYIELIMDEEIKKLAKEFANAIETIINSSNKTFREEKKNIFNKTNSITEFTATLVDFKNKTEHHPTIEKVVEYVNSKINYSEFKQFVVYSSFFVNL